MTQGKIRCIAISAQDHEHDALLEVISQNLIDGVQVIFNLFESRPMSAVLPLAQQRGVGVIARCVYDSGGLSDSLSMEDFAKRRFSSTRRTRSTSSAWKNCGTTFVPSDAASVPELALRFVLSVPGVSAATLGMPDTALVDATIAAAESRATAC